MSGPTVDVPKVGPVGKGPLIAIVVGGVAYVVWRRYQAGQQTATAAAADPGTGFEDGGTIPAVAGAGPGQSVGLPDGSTPPASSDSYGFNGTTNSQWSQYAASQLSGTGSMDYTDVLVTLGQYLSGAPLSTQQQSVVQAAIAVAGYPPEGYHPIVPGGGVPMMVAPTGLHNTTRTTSAVGLAWTSVAGASRYRVYEDGQPVTEVTGPAATVTGLTANESHAWQVAALSAGGNEGPKSAAVTVRTLAQRTTLPATVTPPATRVDRIPFTRKK